MAKYEDFERANQRAKQASVPRAIAARYDRRRHRIVVELTGNLELSFSPRQAQGLERAKPSQLEHIEISPSGFGIGFPDLDADLYVPGLLEGLLGSRKWMAAKLGHSGGKSKSPAKRAASRENGKLGGRPRKSALTAFRFRDSGGH